MKAIDAKEGMRLDGRGLFDQFEAMRDVILQAATRAARPADAPTPDDKLKWTLDNIFTLARRELKRDLKGKPPRTQDMWGHVIRLCTAVGCESRLVGILREEDAAPLPPAWHYEPIDPA